MDLIRIAAVMLGSRAAAEDAVQDAFCGLFRKWHPTGRSAQRPALRALRRDEPVPVGATPPGPAGAPGRITITARSTRTPRSRRQSSEEEHRDVLAALRRLPDRQREALILRYFMDLPEPEIATAMGISQGTVKSTTSRALAALARRLKERS